MVRTPRSKWLVIVAALVLYAVTPVVETLYYLTELARGSYPPNADSIGIPVYQTILSLAVVAPLYLILLWLSTRHYAVGARLTAWNPNTAIRGFLWTAICGGLAALLLIDGAILGYYRHPLSVLHRGLLAYVFLLIRAAAIPAGPAQQATAADDTAAGTSV
jgi:hypothetical protein